VWRRRRICHTQTNTSSTQPGAAQGRISTVDNNPYSLPTGTLKLSWTALQQNRWTQIPTSHEGSRNNCRQEIIFTQFLTESYPTKLTFPPWSCDTNLEWRSINHATTTPALNNTVKKNLGSWRYFNTGSLLAGNLTTQLDHMMITWCSSLHLHWLVRGTRATNGDNTLYTLLVHNRQYMAMAMYTIRDHVRSCDRCCAWG